MADREIGFEVFNQVQSGVPGPLPQDMKDNFSEMFAFWGAIDQQNLLPNGSVEELEHDIIEEISILDKDGGYMIAPMHILQNDVSPERVLKFIEIMQKTWGLQAILLFNAVSPLWEINLTRSQQIYQEVYLLGFWLLRTFHEWGAAGIKYGFLSQETNDRKTFVDLTREITRLCAKYRMLVDFHDNPVHPGGEERTWPNRITLEYCHGQQDSRKSFGPEIAVTVPFINGLSGPLDMANGYYDLNGLQNRSKVDKNGLNSTVVGETARCLINYSPLMILPDNGDVYNQKKDLFRFIRDMPDTWDETRFLGGEPGEFIVIARRSGRNWFVAGNTNDKARRVDLKLDFLEGREYNLIRYQDTKDSHFQKNKESYEVHIGSVVKDQVLTLPMAPGGGFCIKIIAE